MTDLPQKMHSPVEPKGRMRPFRAHRCTRRSFGTVRDVAAHLVGVNAFWRGSICAGLAGAPTRVLMAFDPAATPPSMVQGMGPLTTQQVFDEFVSTTVALLDVVAG